jgi:hypothetical protein
MDGIGGGSLRLTTAGDDRSHLANFTDLTDLVGPFESKK